MKIPFNKSQKNLILKYRDPLDHSVGNVYSTGTSILVQVL
jgi:hypothetical protein